MCQIAEKFYRFIPSNTSFYSLSPSNQECEFDELGLIAELENKEQVYSVTSNHMVFIH